MYLKGFIILLLFYFPALAWGQEGFRCRHLPVRSNTIAQQSATDSLTIVASSIRLMNQSDTSKNLRLHLNTSKNAIYFSFAGPDSLANKKQTSALDSVWVCYRVFDFGLHRPFRLRSGKLYDSTAIFTWPATAPVPIQIQQQIFGTPGISKSGSLSRGFSVGNTQSVFVNSALNLQLEGQLSPTLYLKASIIDQQVPFQPQGNTQQLREFDRVLISLESQKLGLQAGDLVFENRKDPFFLRYYKNVQGLQGYANYDFATAKHQTRAGVGSAKGKFYSLWLPVVDGLQGPYRLSGSDGERFIIVLPNSEKVFLDGIPLIRGYNQDYVIDYNTGEITFTQNRLITRFSRLRIDFEYTQQNYSRTAWLLSHQTQIKNTVLGFETYSEADNPARPLGFQPNDSLIAMLQMAQGRSSAIIPTAQAVNERPEGAPLYEKNWNGTDSIFVYQPNISTPNKLFQVVFSQTPDGQGDYILVSSAVNGRLYRWAGPGLGNHLAARMLPLPNAKKMQLFYVQSNIKKWILKAEWANSNANLNRYAPAGKYQGNAAKVQINRSDSIGGNIGWLNARITTGIYSEYIQAGFQAIDRFRTPEFDRNWNAGPIGTFSDTLKSVDRLIGFKTNIRRDSLGKYEFGAEYRNKQQMVDGSQLHFEVAEQIKKVQFWADGFFLNNDGLPGAKSIWRRNNIGFKYLNNLVQPSYSYATDKNVISAADSITASAMYFEQHTASLQTTKKSRLPIEFSYIWRTDSRPQDGQMREATYSQTYQARIPTLVSGKNSLAANLIYRTLQEKLLAGAPLETTLMGRLDWLWKSPKGSLKSELSLSPASGRELRRQYQYVKMADPNLAAFKWIDSNQDQIPQLEEFVEAALPQDRQYARLLIPTTDFISAYSQNLVWRADLQPYRNQTVSRKWQRFLTRWNWVNALQFERKSTSKRFENRLLPLERLQSEALIMARQSYRSIFFLDPGRPAGGAEIGINGSQNKQFLTAGFELRRRNQLRIAARKTLGPKLSGSLATVATQLLSESDFMPARTYLLRYLDLQPEIAWQPNAGLRLGYGFWYEDRRAQSGPQRASLTRQKAEIRISKASNTNISANLQWVVAKWSEEQTQTPIAYEMLEGLLPGNNLLLSLNIQQKLRNGLQLTLNYEGRKSENQTIAHLGSMRLVALF